MPKEKKSGITIDTVNLTGSVNLSMAHSIIIGNKPDIVTVENVAQKLKDDSSCDVMSFGLFETASPNYTTYYPEVTAEDLSPKDVDFIMPIFRMLSKTIVSKFAPIDFSQNNVLKKSMKLLLGQTINIDHEMAVGNAIGAISKVFWQESYKSRDGHVIPAGINAVMKIDGKSNPRIARGIMMEPPSIHSNSVTVNFKWKPSHKFESVNQFYDALGTYNKEGELVRLVVEEIRSYHETSLVSHGADVFAQKVGDDNEIVNPGYAKRVYNFSAETPAKVNTAIDYKSESLSLSAKSTIPFNINKNNNLNNTGMEELIKELAAKFGLEVSELDKDNLAEKLSAVLAEKETQVTTLTSENTQLKQDVQDLGTKVSTAETERGTFEQANAKFEGLLKNTRDEAVRLYKLAKGEKVDENILNLITGSDVATASSFVRQYQTEVDDKHPLTCKSCNSTDVQRQSSVTSKDGIVDEQGNPITQQNGAGSTKGNAEVMKDLKARKAQNKNRLSLREVPEN